MSTIVNGLLLPQFPIRPWDEAVRSMNQAETGLLQLQEMKRQQETAARTRQFLQEHPELVLGQGGGSVLGSLQTAPGGPPSMPGAGPMTPQQVMPGQPPSAPQMVPGGQGLSRYANVPPQGGGPIPPDVMAQSMPQVTPPQGQPGGSVLASLGGQPQGQQQALQHRFLLDLARTSPDAAMQVQQLMQGQQDMALKRDEQRLTMGTKVAEYVGRVAQGITSPETLEQARQELARIHPQAAAQLPQTYSKEAMRPFIEKALSVKDSATVRLETWKNQIEEQKLGVQLANAGYQGLGTEVTGILRGLTPEQVKEFGGRTSEKAIAYATAEVRKLDIEKREKEGLAGAQATAQAKQQARLDQTVSEAFGERTTKIYDTQTGDPVDSRMRVKDYEAMPPGRARELSTNLSEQMENVRTSIPIITQLQAHIDKIYGPGGALSRMTSDERADLTAAPERWAKQYAQKYPELIQAQRFIDSNAGALARALAGEKGAMAEGDVERAKAMLPQLETSLRVWPPSKLAVQAPDTSAVALRSMNSIVDLVNGRVRTLLGNDQFSHPKLHRYQTADEAQQASGGPTTSPPVQPPDMTPARPWWNPYLIPPKSPAAPTQLNPNLPPVPGQPPSPAPQPPAAAVPAPGARVFPPAPAIRIPGETAAPPTPPTPPTATSTPAQDEAYRQSQGQGRPQAPAPRSTPGRQSQAPAGTRLAGAPKYMELADVAEAMRQTGRSRREVEAAARSKGYTVYGSKLKLPEETAIG